MEGWRPIRVEEYPEELINAGYNTEVVDGHLVTNAPVDWSPDDLRTEPPPPPEPQELNSSEIPDLPAEKPENIPTAEPENEFPDGPSAPVTVDDLFAEFKQHTEVDAQIETGEINPDEPKPESERSAGTGINDGTGKRPGNLTDSEFDEAQMAIEIAHQAIVNGNAWLMQMVAGEGKVEDYMQIDKKKFDRWTVIGAKLADKYGIKFPLEALYFMSAGQNLGPAWQLAVQNYRQRKKIATLEKTNEELRWKTFLMENVGKINASAPPPPPSKDYPTVAPPPKSEDLHIQEQNGWVFNSTEGSWTNRSSKKKMLARDGDYIFNPDRGVMVHFQTGVVKEGQPKKVKVKEPKTGPVRGPGGKFLSKEEIKKLKEEGRLHEFTTPK